MKELESISGISDFVAEAKFTILGHYCEFKFFISNKKKGYLMTKYYAMLALSGCIIFIKK